MRFALAVLLLAGCAGGIPTFVKPTTPGLTCKDACIIGEMECVYDTSESNGYFLFGPFVIGGQSATRGIRVCELSGKLCDSRCSPAP